MNGQREWKPWIHHAMAWSAVALLAAATIVGCSQAGAGVPSNADRAKSASPGRSPRVQTVTVQSQDLANTIELPGSVEGYETADLYAKVGGYLAEINVDIGDHVTQGQLLARLHIPEMENELAEKEAAIAASQAEHAQSQAALHQAQTALREKQAHVNMQQAEFERVTDLVERGSLQRQLLDEATYKRDAAQAALDTVHASIQTAEATLKSAAARIQLVKAERDRVQTLLQYAEIRAPFDGVIVKRQVDPGAFVQSADGNSSARPLVTVTRIDRVRIRLDLPMAEVKWLERGDRVVFDRINVLPDARFEGEVTRFATALDRDSRLMRVEVDLENPDHQLLPGYYGYVTVFLQEMPQASVVPSSAIFQNGSETCVYVVENGVCRKRMVKPCYQDGTIVGVETGISAGEQVVAAGSGQLQDGQQVVAVNTGDSRVALQ